MTDDFWAQLLNEDAAPTLTGSSISWEELRRRYPVPAQQGPLRVMASEGQCTHSTSYGSRHYNCGCPTPYQVKGRWYCSVHALQVLNKMIIDGTEGGNDQNILEEPI